MSDKLKIIAIGDAGVNSISTVNHEFIYLFRNKDDWEKRGKIMKTEYSIIVTSPAGRFSSRHLITLTERLKSNNEKVFLIAIMPFFSESSERMDRANETLQKLKGKVDHVIIVDNENFAQKYMNLPLGNLLDSINNTISKLINDLKEKVDSVSGFKNLGFAYAEADTLSKIESEITFTRGKSSPEGIVGVVGSPTFDDAVKLSQNLGIEMLEYKHTDKYELSAFTIHDHSSYNLSSPLELYIRIQ